jgi:hypothetical protein
MIDIPPERVDRAIAYKEGLKTYRALAKSPTASDTLHAEMALYGIVEGAITGNGSRPLAEALRLYNLYSPDHEYAPVIPISVRAHDEQGNPVINQNGQWQERELRFWLPVSPMNKVLESGRYPVLADRLTSNATSPPDLSSLERKDLTRLVAHNMAVTAGWDHGQLINWLAASVAVEQASQLAYTLPPRRRR